MSGTAKPRVYFVRLAIAACLSAAACAGQPPAVSAEPPDQPEVSTREEKATFTAHVNLVTVPVVVRDKQGHIVAGLTKESFRLFDKGKPQEIERFTVERPGAAGTPPAPEPAPPGEEAASAAADRPALAKMPRRFVGYLFDDVHLEAGDLIRVRQAAERHMYGQLNPTDRAAIFTTSGQGTVDFTDDLGQLREGLAHLMPRPLARSGAQECPDISFYQADMMINRGDPQAIAAAVAETIVCMNMNTSTPAGLDAARALAMAAARRALSAGRHETQVTLATLKDTVRRMAAAPGERLLVLVSPGFYNPLDRLSDENDSIERALRANVVINVLNARGLYTTNVDASQRVVEQTAQRIKDNMQSQSELIEEGLLNEIAAGTGGFYFHNNNDLVEGFRRTATGPELYYVLGFQPQNLKLDGSFHGLKVAIESKAGYTIEARRGYYAPTRLEDAAATAKREIEDAVFSREEMSDLPVELHTQFFKGAGDTATVTLLAHVDLAGLKFRKADGRNLNNITVVSALFDHNGKVVTGLVKHLDLRLRNESLQYRLAHGVTFRMGLEARPGSYVVRVVVRETEGQLMSAINRAVDIP
jgi:VWFA-related protein